MSPRVRMLWSQRRWSLVAAMFLAMGVFIVASWAVGSLGLLRLAGEAEDRLDRRNQEHIGQLLLNLTDHELDEMGPEANIAARVAMAKADSESLGSQYVYQIWAPDGELLFANFGEGLHAPMVAFKTTGFGKVLMDGRTWSVYAYTDPKTGRQIQVAEHADPTLDLGHLVDGRVAFLIGGSLLLLLVPGYVVIKWVVHPVAELARLIRHRSVDSLEPLPTAELPREVAPIVHAMNALLRTVSENLQHERAFIGLAAHELRTPLAAVRVHAQLVRAADDEAKRDDAIDRLIQAADRCGHLVDQLLTIQRLDAARGAASTDVIDTMEVTMEVVASLRTKAQRREVLVASNFDGSHLRAHRFAFFTLVRNLLSNAIRYSPAGGRVRVSARRQGDGVLLRIEDSGPGIAVADRERVFDRFQRLSTQNTEGVGLGMSIVRTVAQMLDARVTLGEASLGGLLVEVRFPGRVVTDGGLPSDFDEEELLDGQAAGS